MNRHDLTYEQWARVEPLLPPVRSGRPGRPYHDHRRILNGILWLAKTGVPWRDLPERFGPWKTVANRFYRWRQAGIWQRVFAVLLQQADRMGRSTGRCISSIERASVSISMQLERVRGQRATRDEAVGRSRGGLTTKVHVRSDGNGSPVVLLLSAGHRHDTTASSLPCCKPVACGVRGAVDHARARCGLWLTKGTRASTCVITAVNTASAR